VPVFNTILLNLDWDVLIIDSPSVNIATQNFTKCFLDSASECIPNKEVTIRPSDKPWFDSILRKQIAEFVIGFESKLLNKINLLTGIVLKCKDMESTTRKNKQK